MVQFQRDQMHTAQSHLHPARDQSSPATGRAETAHPQGQARNPLPPKHVMRTAERAQTGFVEIFAFHLGTVQTAPISGQRTAKDAACTAPGYTNLIL